MGPGLPGRFVSRRSCWEPWALSSGACLASAHRSCGCTSTFESSSATSWNTTSRPSPPPGAWCSQQASPCWRDNSRRGVPSDNLCWTRSGTSSLAGRLEEKHVAAGCEDTPALPHPKVLAAAGVEPKAVFARHLREAAIGFQLVRERYAERDTALHRRPLRQQLDWLDEQRFSPQPAQVASPREDVRGGDRVGTSGRSFLHECAQRYWLVIEDREQWVQPKGGGQPVRSQVVQIGQPFARRRTARLEGTIPAFIEARHAHRDALDLRTVVREQRQRALGDDPLRNDADRRATREKVGEKRVGSADGLWCEGIAGGAQEHRRRHRKTPKL